MAIAMLSISAMAHEDDFGLTGSGNVDILGQGIFETDGSLMKYPAGQDTNIDTLEVGDDKALAIGSAWHNVPLAKATNNLEIKKNQDSGKCSCCNGTLLKTTYEAGGDIIEEQKGNPCTDCCIKVNIDQIKVGNRNAMAFGFADATNNVKIVANQQ
jgi:hypothetical protein